MTTNDANEACISDADDIDSELAACLNLTQPRSFFLFAGAGSGKTRSLVNVLRHAQRNFSEALRLKGQRISVITYTNAARDEIKRRLQFDPIIDVRTIHSFAWSLINGLDNDIRKWLQTNLLEKTKELLHKEESGRAGTKASEVRARKIESNLRRIKALKQVRRFTYSPQGDNLRRDSLNHAEVLGIASNFITKKPAMQAILTGRYPILLVDESQDTNKHIITALFKLQASHPNHFLLGLFGDMMQRIYNDGQEGLGKDLPDSWATPSKSVNYRSPNRVVTLINRVRATTDSHVQIPREGADEGVVRLFLLPTKTADKPATERAISVQMARITGDDKWADPHAVKTLTLEHRMAATRMGFSDLFSPLYEVQSWRTSFLGGVLPATRFFTDQILPLVKAAQSNDRFAVARIMKSDSPLLTPQAIFSAEDKGAQLLAAREAVKRLMALWANESNPTLFEVLQCVYEQDLLPIPRSLLDHAIQGDRFSEDTASPITQNKGDEESEKDAAIAGFLRAPYSQLEPFARYIKGESCFDTHQGVKGLEFDRVMVVMDDEEARGFLFKYEKLFGETDAASKTAEATRRLFYVTCSRAMQSLALVAYANSPTAVKQFVSEQGWFSENEIILEL
ncbi:MAG: DNA helicase [Planctomycetota bacterium]|nr:MAG: DNA helicase [Planctomycetota bacterium]